MSVKLIAALTVLALAACAESQPYPSDHRRAEFADGRVVYIIGAKMSDVCAAIAARTCDDAACCDRVIERCAPGGGQYRIEWANDAGWHEEWWRCLYAIDDEPWPRLGTTRPRACVRLTPGWTPKPLPPGTTH